MKFVYYRSRSILEIHYPLDVIKEKNLSDEGQNHTDDHNVEKH